MDIHDWYSDSSTDSQSDSDGPSSPPPAPSQPLPKIKLILPPLRQVQQRQAAPEPPPPPVSRPVVSYYEAPVAGPSKKSKSSKSAKSKGSSKSKKRKWAYSEYADERAPPKAVKLKPLKEVLSRLLASFKKKDAYMFFSRPVNAASVPGYADIIKRPMDFATMSVKVQRGRYRSLEEFTEDFRLVTGNAKIFNPPDNMYHTEAERIEVWGLDQISKAAATVIQYETDWNIEIENDDVPDDPADDYAAVLEEVEMLPVERSRSPSLAIAGPGPTDRRNLLRPRAAKDNPSESTSSAPTKETVDTEGRLPGSKDGVGAFPPGSAWAKTMLSLKLKPKQYKTKKERLRVESHGPPTLSDGSLDYREVENPFNYLSALVPEPPTRPQLTPIFPPPPPPPKPTDMGTPSRDTPDVKESTPPPTIGSIYPLPTLLPKDLQHFPTTPSKMRHWTVHRNFGNRRPEPLPTFERAWEEPRDAHMLDLGSFAELAGLLNGALRSAGLQPNTPESREDLDSLVKETVRATVDPIPPPPLVTASMFTTEPEQPYWGKERTAEAESYLVDVVYGGVDGLAYVRSLAEFVGTPALDRDEPSDEDVKMEDAEDTKPSVYPLGSSLASWVEQNVVGPLTGRRHELLNRVAAETKGKKRAMDVDDKIGAQVAVATNVRPAAFAGLKLLQQLFAHKVDMTALLYAPAEVAQSEVEWAGKTIGVAANAATTPAQTKAVLEHTAKLIAELERNPSTGAESAAMRNLRLNLLALLRRAPVDTIAMLPAEMVREDLREFIPTLPAAGTLLTSTYVR